MEKNIFPLTELGILKPVEIQPYETESGHAQFKVGGQGLEEGRRGFGLRILYGGHDVVGSFACLHVIDKKILMMDESRTFDTAAIFGEQSR